MKYLLFIPVFILTMQCMADGLPLYYWQHGKFTNFGDELSYQLVNRIIGKPIRKYNKNSGVKEKKLLAIGSIISFADTGDVIWGSGIKKESLHEIKYKFTTLDVRAVRGPLSRHFLMTNFNIPVPEIYGDPALLVPYFFPELHRNPNPKYDYIIIPHYTEQVLYPKLSPQEIEKMPAGSKYTIVYPTDPWNEVVAAICDSKFVISGSLHGIIVAEAYGIPARFLRLVTRLEPLFKYQDYYYGTGRLQFGIAFSVKEALEMGGEVPMQCDLEKLYYAFPFEFWPDVNFVKPDFTQARK